MRPPSSKSKTPSTPTPTGPFAKASPTSATPTAKSHDIVESPSIGSSNALARFEYESGRTRDCTKVLMVEWEDDDKTREITGDWAVRWESKVTLMPARDTSVRGINRLYFLLPASERVPGTVTLTLTADDTGGKHEPVVWKANPLPAIFPPELGASAREEGKKGVLHTIWAKRRLQVLAKEIDEESQHNIEGVALTMALQEKEWIEQNFGVTTRPSISHTAQKGSLGSAGGLNSPTSPRSPGGSRLMDKLKGLKLATADKDLVPSPVRSHHADDEDPDLADNLNPLSPEQSDVAVSSFGSFAELKGMPDPGTLAAKPPQNPVASRMAPQRPPEALLAAQRQQGGGMGSLNAVASGTSRSRTAIPVDNRDDEREDDLFALPISPRSPDMGVSPFSFAASDTRQYVRGEGP